MEEKEESFFKMPPGHKVIMEEEIDGMRIRVVKSNSGCNHVFCEDKTEDRRFIPDLALLEPTTRVMENLRYWFCNNYDYDKKKKIKPKRQRRRLVKAFREIRGKPQKKKKPLHVAKTMFKKMLVGKRLSDLAEDLMATKQSDTRIVVHGPRSSAFKKLLDEHGKFTEKTKAGAGWVMDEEAYERLKNSLGSVKK